MLVTMFNRALLINVAINFRLFLFYIKLFWSIIIKNNKNKYY